VEKEVGALMILIVIFLVLTAVRLESKIVILGILVHYESLRKSLPDTQRFVKSDYCTA